MQAQHIIFEFLPFTFILLLPSNASAQLVQWDWVRQAGGGSDDYPYMVTVDKDGNIYTTGKFNNVAIFGDTILQTPSFHSRIFITKLDSSGNFLWAFSDYSESHVFPNWISTDMNNNIYLTGDFIDSLAFDSLYLTSDGDMDGYILKIDKYGNYQWLYQIGNPGWLESKGIVVDSFGSVFLTGGFHDSIAIDSFSLYGSGFWDIFLLKISVNQDINWIKGYGDINGDIVKGITIDNNQNIICTGNFNSYSIFDDTTITSFGGSDAFIMKVNPDGELQWVRNMGGTSTDVGYSVTCDSGNNVFVMGYFMDTSYFGDTAIVSIPPLTDLFYSKLSPDGEFLWTKSIVASFSSADEHYRHSIECDDIGNLYMTVWFWDTIYVEGVPYYSTGVYDSFIMKTDPNGNMIWIKQITGTESQYYKSLDIDNYGNIYVTGRFYGTAYFDSLELTSYGTADIFIGKLHEEPLAVNYNIREKKIEINLYPNPARDQLNIESSDSIKKVEIYSPEGKLVKEFYDNIQQLDVLGFPSGTYILKVYFKGSVHSQKVVIY